MVMEKLVSAEREPTGGKNGIDKPLIQTKESTFSDDNSQIVQVLNFILC